MDVYQKALDLKNIGNYSESIRVLDSIEPKGQLPFLVLKAELLELTGGHQQARHLAHTLLKNGKLAEAQRANCESILARVLFENGDVDEALKGFQRAMSFSAKAGDLRQLCWIQGKLVGILAEQAGRDAAAPLLAELRRNVTRVGDPHTTAQAHLYVAEMEGRQGNLEAARRHVAVSQDLLQDSPNLWLAAFAENVLLAVSVLESAIGEAAIHSVEALRLSEQSGAASVRRSAAANTGTMHFLTGNFERAFEHFAKALTFLPSEGERNNAILEALAQITLAQNNLNECDELLTRIDSTIRRRSEQTLYSHRHAQLTRGRLLAKQGNNSEALRSVDHALDLAEATGDTILRDSALLTRAELLHVLGRRSECMRTLRQVFAKSGAASAETIARYQAIVALLLLGDGERDLAELSMTRALAIFSVATNAPVVLALKNSQQKIMENGGIPSLRHIEGNVDFQAGARSVLCLLSAAMLQITRPEVVASVVGDALLTSGCIHSARVLEQPSNGSSSTLREIGDDVALGEERSFTIGAACRARRIQLIVRSMSNFEAEATLNLMGPFIDRIRELHEAQVDKERRAVLWPIEEHPETQGGAVISGHMRELMTFAQRVARTTVNVLITGESGTGKEILARAIHDFSDRAQKPFVPFNCAAIPRDLVESQLFGHRRGAFTGADRDQLGLIRSAADGTVFLDEVGEMSIDLQPKLLRFLESGEIAPLGEPSPFNVSVRVIAATNANLEDAVRDGKFREDLFYRLNVVRLAIKPLRERRDEIPAMVQHFVAAAAREFKKGQLQVSEDTMERLLLFRWPGNVRQLQNEIRRMVALAEPNSSLEPAAISPDILRAMPDLRQPLPGSRQIAVALDDKLQPTLSRVEYEMIKAALRTHHGKVHPAAKSLGISRKGLYLKRQRLGL